MISNSFLLQKIRKNAFKALLYFHQILFYVYYQYMKIYSLALLVSLLHMVCSMHLNDHLAQQPSICWINAQHLSTQFPSCYQRVQIQNLCYAQCPIGFSRIQGDCVQRCPAGNQWKEEGLLCKNINLQYGRGLGYSVETQCQQVYGKGNCEYFKSNSKAYPKCKQNYSPVGCCVCRLTKIDCRSLGFIQKDDFTCQRLFFKGNPIPKYCNQKLDTLDIITCRIDSCPNSMTGYGPLCLSNDGSPKNKKWVKCDELLFAANSMVCDKAPFKSLSRIGKVAMNIVLTYRPTLPKIRQDQQKLKMLKNNFNQLRKLTNYNQEFQVLLDNISKLPNQYFPSMREGKNIDQILGYYGYPDEDLDLSPQNMIRLSEQAADLISMTLKSKYPNCNQIK